MLRDQNRILKGASSYFGYEVINLEKVVVGMSGGVDSAVAALLLKKSGYDVVGVTLRTWQSDEDYANRCCDIDDARSTAHRIGIDYYPVNCTSDFQRFVVEPFKNSYVRGLTPNPCIECNRYVKWEKLLYYSKVVGAKYIATGHYASVVKLDNGRYTVKQAEHAEKDQTYMLWKLTQDQLESTLMPLGGLSKTEVREIAKEAGLPVASKPDSQEICFVTNGSYADYIEGARADGDTEGYFIDTQGNILGRHRGIIHYTVGQRKGIGLALGYPVYVKEIRAKTNEVVLCGEQSLYGKEIICSDVNFMSIPGLKTGEELACSVKIRYRHQAQPAIIAAANDGSVKISFSSPVRAATPGQSAVFYDSENRIIGGGVITKICDA